MEYLGKPDWKIEAEKNGESLPEYWTMSEVARLLDVALTYPVRLCKQAYIPTYKIGQVRFVREENIEALVGKLKR